MSYHQCLRCGSNHGSLRVFLCLYDLVFLVAWGLPPTGTKKMTIIASMRKNININNSFRCTNITNFRDLRKNLPKKMMQILSWLKYWDSAAASYRNTADF